MDLSIENDAQEAVRKAYFEYLDGQLKNDQVERQHRAERFDNGQPAEKDVAAIKAAREAYIQTASHGGTDLQATDAARDALYGQFDREEFKKKEIDPTLYSTNPEYHTRMNEKMDLNVEEKRQERQPPQELANTPGLEASTHTESQQRQEQQHEIDWNRYNQDRDYRVQVNEQEQRLEQEQQQQVTVQHHLKL